MLIIFKLLKKDCYNFATFPLFFDFKKISLLYMVFLRRLLFPFSIVYGFVTAIRNYMFDIGLLKSHTFDIPVIAVGNLRVGGTGKTPQIEYLIRLLQSHYKVATLSRGYKRKTTGFIIADSSATVQTIGDEPLQYFKKFANIVVAVDANRTNGIEQIIKQKKTEVILLDDAFQHRKVRAGLYILLTTFNDLYVDDWILPAGNLREGRGGAARANIIIVTKCPNNLSLEDRNRIIKKLNVSKNQYVYFSFIEYDTCVISKEKSLPFASILNEEKIIIAGIAKPESFIDYVKREDDQILIYDDHHDFSDAEIAEILAEANGRKIITTEKDYVRLCGKIPAEMLFYLPIKSTFVANKENFDNTIINYVGKSSRNR